jgi:hypothetical protein
MSQRIKRSQDRKMTISTGGLVAQHGRGEAPVVRVPQKVTGDIKPELPKGLAKASPFLKKIEPVVPTSEKDEKDAIAKASKTVKDDKSTAE